MKLNLDELNKRAATLANRDKEEDNQYKVKYDRKVGSIEEPDSWSHYAPEMREMAKEVNWRVVPTLKMALEQRASGKLVLSIRETDIMLRMGLTELDKLLIGCLSDPDIAGVIHERNYYLPGDNSPMNLRNSYNQGIEWFKNHKEKASNQAVRKASRRMQEIRDKLVKLNLPLWDTEIEHGIPTELLKPEFHSWEQWSRLKRNPIKTIDPQEIKV